MAPIIMDTMSVRPATAADLPRISAIYDEQVATAISTFDLEPREARYWQQRLRSDEPGDHLLVAEDDGAVVGYAYSSTYRVRPGYAHTRESSVYLDDPAQGRGLGSALYVELIARMREDAVHTVLAVVALPNEASEALHVSFGFERVGVLREVGWKFERWIDTALYQLMLEP
jgi:phosphinothricin acetyltransferase